MGLDRRFEIVGRAFQVPDREVFNLVEVFETVKFPEQSSLVTLWDRIPVNVPQVPDFARTRSIRRIILS
jgi:hypothetical protein